MQKIPCEDCISIVICKQIILNDLDFPITNLKRKCSLFTKFLESYICNDGNNISYILYTTLEKCFKLNFKIEEKQVMKWENELYKNNFTEECISIIPMR